MQNRKDTKTGREPRAVTNLTYTLEAFVHLLPDCTIVSNHINLQRNGNVAVI